MNKASENIFNGENFIVPLAEVVFIEKYKADIIIIIFKGTTWSEDIDGWANTAELQGAEAEAFMEAWLNYRAKIEGVKQEG